MAMKVPPFHWSKPPLKHYPRRPQNRSGNSSADTGDWWNELE